jgi:hypothetical protein
MQESEFTGCVNKVQGKPPSRREKHQNRGLFRAIPKKQFGRCIDASRSYN